MFQIYLHDSDNMPSEQPHCRPGGCQKPWPCVLQSMRSRRVGHNSATTRNSNHDLGGLDIQETVNERIAWVMGRGGRNPPESIKFIHLTSVSQYLEGESCGIYWWSRNHQLIQFASLFSVEEKQENNQGVDFKFGTEELSWKLLSTKQEKKSDDMSSHRLQKAILLM